MHTTALIVFLADLVACHAAPAWRKWHSRRLETAQKVSSKGLMQSLGLHMDGQLLLDRVLPDINVQQYRRGKKLLKSHQAAIDKVFDARDLGHHVEPFVNALRRSEHKAGRHYENLFQSGIMSMPKAPSHEELAGALREATGIDAFDQTHAHAELFRIMAKHWDYKPPVSALGVSAKFHVDGRVEKARYHVALQLPCGADWNAHRLAKSAGAAADALKAPAPVRSWVAMIENMPKNSIDSLGFGLAVLSDGQVAGKIYVTNPVGSPMPRLPLGGGHVIADVLPMISQSPDSTMVSLEWVVGDEKVALRHYSIQRDISHEQRVLDFAGPGPLSERILDLMRMSKSATETVRYTLPFSEEEVVKSNKAPELSKVKLGLQISDEYMADERFQYMAQPVLGVLGVDAGEVEKWISSSSKVGHTVSNIQSGSSYVTLYRHPLHLCSLEHRLKSRRLTATPCTAAQEEFQSNAWSGGGCHGSMQKSTACESCSSGGEPNGNCYAVCQSDWTKSCSSNCTAEIANVRSQCSGCHEFKTWCGKKGQNGLPDSWPNAAFEGCDGTCCDDDNVCLSYMEANHADATYTTAFTDGELVELFEGALGGVPENCKYPMYPWYGNDFPLCSSCRSVYNAMHQMFLWGGPCEYVKGCDNATDKTACATSKGWKCGCDCINVLSKVNEVCTSGTELCASEQPSRCKNDDDDYFNNCDSGTYSSFQSSTFLWGESMTMSQCYVNDVWATQCLQDAEYTSAQKLTWYVEGLQMENTNALPAGCCDTPYQTTGNLIAPGGASGGATAGTTITPATTVTSQVQLPMDIPASVTSGADLLSNTAFKTASENAVKESLNLQSGTTVEATSFAISTRRLEEAIASLGQSDSEEAPSRILVAKNVQMTYNILFPAGTATSTITTVRGKTSSGGAGANTFASTLQTTLGQKLTAASLTDYSVTGTPSAIGQATASVGTSTSDDTTSSAFSGLINSAIALMCIHQFFTMA